MKKIVSTLIFTILLASCSSTTVKELPSDNRNALTYNLEIIKEDLKKGNTVKFRDFFHNNIRNRYILNELDGVDFTQVSTFYSPPTFKGDEAENVIAFSSQGQTFYYNVSYKYIEGQWKIINIS